MLTNKFICASYDYSTYTDFVPAPLFRRVFEVHSPSACKITVTGLGFYELFINGKKITKGIIAPYVSNPDHCVYFDEYDLLPFLHEGKNAVGFILGNGMQNAPGGQIWDFDIADFRGAPRLAFCIEATQNNGEKLIIEADTNVKTAPSAIIFDDLRCGCFYDARNETDGWCAPDFDDSAWAHALKAETPRGTRRLCEAESILPCGEPLKPVSVTKCRLACFDARNDVAKQANSLPSKEREGWLYDFGVNTSGIETLRIKGKKGQQIDIQFAEFINAEGEADYGNIRFYPDGYAQRDIYILKGGEEEEFTPMFTYHGARYAVVLGLEDAQATRELLTYTPYFSALEQRGGFTCSDETANALQKLSINSTRSNFFYFPTDCPHREKNGWTGDASVSAEQMSLNFAPENSYREWLNNIRKAQTEKGELPGIIPTGTWGYAWGNGPAWDAVLINLPWQTYIMRGDKRILEENAPSLLRYADYISRNRTERGTVKLGLGDWCPVTAVKAPLELTDSLMSMDNLKKSAFIFEALGQKLQRDFCLTLRGEIRAATRKYLLDFASMTAAGRCQTSQAMAVYYDLFDEAEKYTAVQKLVSFIHEADDHIDFGLLGSRTVFRVLADYGYADLAFKMITRTDYPSYGMFIKRGLTALPEDFKRDDEYPNSLNHHFMGDISAWFFLYLAGIRVNPYGDSCKYALVAPAFVEALDFAEGHYDTVCGRLSVRWEKKNGGIELKIKAPAALDGEIRLPDGYMFADTQLNHAELDTDTYEVCVNKYFEN